MPNGIIEIQHTLAFQKEQLFNDVIPPKRVQYFEDVTHYCDGIEDSIEEEKKRRKIYRTAEVSVLCCEANQGGSLVQKVTEIEQCRYEIQICSERECQRTTREEEEEEEEKRRRRGQEKGKTSQGEEELMRKRLENLGEGRVASEEEKALDRVRRMFYHAFNGYMQHAYPAPELLPLSCTGGVFDLVKLPMVTLIDTLDTLVVLGDYANFRLAVDRVLEAYPSFDIDVNVSVFETTIRILGGLLSAHLMAIDPLLSIYPTYPYHSSSSSFSSSENSEVESYEDGLLYLAMDLGDRLLEAFHTVTGIPYGTVNLRSGVPVGETEEASTAGAGSLLVEFEVLSTLTGDSRYSTAAYRAVKALFDRRSRVDLLGRHIHIRTGRWTEEASGIGSNADSYYEYLLKACLLPSSSVHRTSKLIEMFLVTFLAIKAFVQKGSHICTAYL